MATKLVEDRIDDDSDEIIEQTIPTEEEKKELPILSSYLMKRGEKNKVTSDLNSLGKRGGLY
jgi:hypothetical protein